MPYRYRPATAAAAAVLVWLLAAAPTSATGSQTSTCPGPAGLDQQMVVVQAPTGPFYSWRQCTVLPPPGARPPTLRAHALAPRRVRTLCVCCDLFSARSALAGARATCSSVHLPAWRAAVVHPTPGPATRAGSTKASVSVAWCVGKDTVNGSATEAIDEAKHAGNVTLM